MTGGKDITGVKLCCSVARFNVRLEDLNKDLLEHSGAMTAQEEDQVSSYRVGCDTCRINPNRASPLSCSNTVPLSNSMSASRSSKRNRFYFFVTLPPLTSPFPFDSSRPCRRLSCKQTTNSPPSLPKTTPKSILFNGALPLCACVKPSHITAPPTGPRYLVLIGGTNVSRQTNRQGRNACCPASDARRK